MVPRACHTITCMTWHVEQHKPLRTSRHHGAPNLRKQSPNLDPILSMKIKSLSILAIDVFNLCQEKKERKIK